MAHARRLPRLIEQISLAGEYRGHLGLAVAELEQVVERPHRLERPRHRPEWAIATRVVPGDGGPGVYPRGEVARDLDEHAPARDVAPMVEVRPELPDLPELAEVRRELARHVVPGDVARRVEDPRRLVVRIGRAEIGEQPGAEPLGLADVDHPAHGVRHPVDGRPILRQRADAMAELLEVGGGERDGPLRATGAAHDWQR